MPIPVPMPAPPPRGRSSGSRAMGRAGPAPVLSGDRRRGWDGRAVPRAASRRAFGPDWQVACSDMRRARQAAWRGCVGPAAAIRTATATTTKPVACRRADRRSVAANADPRRCSKLFLSCAAAAQARYLSGVLTARVELGITVARIASAVLSERFADSQRLSSLPTPSSMRRPLQSFAVRPLRDGSSVAEGLAIASHPTEQAQRERRLESSENRASKMQNGEAD